MKPSITTHVVNYNNCIIVIKNVPCEECDQCGEIEYTDNVMKVNRVKNLLQEVSVVDYSKVA